AASSPMSYAVYLYFLNGGAEAEVVRASGTAGPGKPAQILLIAADETDPKNPVAATFLEAVSPGEWANSLVVTVDATPNVPDDQKGKEYSLTIRDESSDKRETYVSVTVGSVGPKNLRAVLAG